MFSSIVNRYLNKQTIGRGILGQTPSSMISNRYYGEIINFLNRNKKLVQHAGLKNYLCNMQD